MNSRFHQYGFWALVVREIKRLKANAIYPYAMIAAPVFCTWLFLSMMRSGLPTDMPIAVVDLDKSSMSRNLIRQLDAFPQTKVVLQASDFYQARTQLQMGNVYAIYLIPRHFMHEVTLGLQPKITFYTNNSYLVAGSLVYRDMKTVSTLISGAVNRQLSLAKGQNLQQTMAQLQPIVIDTHAIGNPWLNYSVYLNNMLLPGILQLLILLVTVFSIGSEIKERTASKWLDMSDDSIIVALTGKLFLHTAIFLLMGISMQWVLYRYLHFPLNNGIMPMITSMFLLVVASQALGIFMIATLPNLRLGLSFASLIGVISISIAGFSFPVFAMHPVLQWASNLFPLRHYFLIYVDQALNGYPVYYSRIQYGALAAFLLSPLPLVLRLKHALKNRAYKM
jgi:ABC-2 type transport system permease protein